LFEFKFPKTKLKVLQIVKDNQEIEARDLAKTLHIGIVHASKLLRDYFLRGLLKRKKRSMSQGGRRYGYSLNVAGEKKLKWLKNFKKQLKSV